MGLVNLKYNVEVQLDSDTFKYPPDDRVVTLSSITQKFVTTVTLATATSKILLHLGSASTDDLTDADFIFIVSNKDLSLELTGTGTEDNSNVSLKANIPFILGYDDTRNYDAAGGFAGVAQNITKITANNASGSTATITVIAAT